MELDKCHNPKIECNICMNVSPKGDCTNYWFNDRRCSKVIRGDKMQQKWLYPQKNIACRYARISPIQLSRCHHSVVRKTWSLPLKFDSLTNGIWVY